MESIARHASQEMHVPMQSQGHEQQQGQGQGQGQKQDEMEIERKRKYNAAEITFEELKPFFEMPLHRVAKCLGICTTVTCRRNKIAKWPYRQLKAIESNIKSLEDASAQRKMSASEALVAQQQIHILKDKQRTLRETATCEDEAQDAYIISQRIAAERAKRYRSDSVVLRPAKIEAGNSKNSLSYDPEPFELSYVFNLGQGFAPREFVDKSARETFEAKEDLPHMPRLPQQQFYDLERYSGPQHHHFGHHLNPAHLGSQNMLTSSSVADLSPFSSPSSSSLCSASSDSNSQAEPLLFTHNFVEHDMLCTTPGTACGALQVMENQSFSFFNPQESSMAHSVQYSHMQENAETHLTGNCGLGKQPQLFYPPSDSEMTSESATSSDATCDMIKWEIDLDINWEVDLSLFE